MRFATYRWNGVITVGMVSNGEIRALAGTNGMLALIEAWMAGERPRVAGEPLLLADVDLLPPVWPPVRNPFCVGWNYLAHIEEGRGKREGREPEALPEAPALFTKATTTVNAPWNDIPLHERITSALDCEAELAVVIGRGGRDIDPGEALSHVFGYCVANDVSARDLQWAYGGQWFKGKSLDGTCPMGPWIVTADEVPDPQSLEITCRVNGDVKQRSNTRHQIFPVARLIGHVSRGLTLLPGDVILTGTPEGVGFARSPPESLGDGDVLETEIEGLGLLRNTIRAGG